MPAFLYTAQFIWWIVGPLVKTALRAIGFGFVTYFGFNAIIGAARDYMITNMGNAGIVIQQILGLAKVDVAINIMLSAVFTRFIIAGINKAQDRKRAQVWRKPGGTSIEA
jgi:exosortase/archaeosortase